MILKYLQEKNKTKNARKCLECHLFSIFLFEKFQFGIIFLKRSSHVIQKSLPEKNKTKNALVCCWIYTTIKTTTYLFC